MNDIFLIEDRVSKLLSIKLNSVQQNVYRGKYETKVIQGIGRGGKQHLIALSSLPEDAQERYYREEEEQEVDRMPDMEYMKSSTQEQREEAEWKLGVIRKFWCSDRNAVAFSEKYNEENDKKITARKLGYWVSQYNENGILGLIDRRGGHNKGKCSIPDEVWDIFYSLYMTTQKRSVRLCYDKVKNKYPDIPSVDVFEKRVQKIPELVRIRYHEGKKALDDKMPYMIRDKSEMVSNQIWCTDHHKADVFVKNNMGKVFRSWITVFTDIRSTKIMGCIVREAEPDTTLVLKCPREGIKAHGIPNEIYTDNGKDYLSKEIDVNNENSVLNILGIGKVVANPYHGQAKPVERFFRTLKERFGKLFYSYAGNDAKKRPKHMKKTNKKLAQDEEIPSFEFYQEQLMNYIHEYNCTPHSGIGMDGKTPDEVYYDNLVCKPQKIDEDVLRILCGRTRVRRVNNNGIKLYSNTFTDKDGKLLEYMGKDVQVKYDGDDMETVYIFETDGAFICKAFHKLHSPFRGVNEEDYIIAGKERKNVRKLLRKNQPKRLKDESEYLFSYITQEHIIQQNGSEQIENDTVKEVEKAVSGTEQEEKFNPFAEMYDACHKKSCS
ncbi:MAG: Mu transposase C-terminal domain-containing protein [Ruminococcus sp.]|nr:Mu transposase C-terminal domain-containing protein [Ruminococcus sp.]